mgnify:CR=1 FL=1
MRTTEQTAVDQADYDSRIAAIHERLTTSRTAAATARLSGDQGEYVIALTEYEIALTDLLNMI